MAGTAGMDILKEVMSHLRDSPLVKVNRKLKDRGGRATGLVDWSLLEKVPAAWMQADALQADENRNGIHNSRRFHCGQNMETETMNGSSIQAVFGIKEGQVEIERGILKPGQWTDDTSMALCLADSLCLCGHLDGSDLRKRFWCWHAEAMNTPWRLDPERKKRTSFGLGYNIAKSLIALYPDEPIDPEYLNPGSSDSGNGGLMRLAPVPIFYNRPEQLEEALDAAARSSLATHPGILATETARYLAFLVHSAINRKEEMSAREFFIQQSAVYAARLGERLAEDPEGQSSADLREIQALATSNKEGPMERCWNWQEPSLELLQTFRARGEKYNGHPVSRCYAGSYCMDGLAMALHAVASTESFHRAIEKAVNFLGDADTVGAIAGQLAGAFYGLEGIDPRR
ncbi:tri1 [Symbiodinium sp. CCMP2456]|nr:tri1 [Symbiodinium sp. CCMP2456]